MIPPAAEEQMAKRMKAKVTSLAAGHVVMLSKPHEVAAGILEAAKAGLPPRAVPEAQRPVSRRFDPSSAASVQVVPNRTAPQRRPRPRFSPRAIATPSPRKRAFRVARHIGFTPP